MWPRSMSSPPAPAFCRASMAPHHHHRLWWRYTTSGCRMRPPAQSPRCRCKPPVPALLHSGSGLDSSTERPEAAAASTIAVDSSSPPGRSAPRSGRPKGHLQAVSTIFTAHGVGRGLPSSPRRRRRPSRVRSAQACSSPADPLATSSQGPLEVQPRTEEDSGGRRA